MIELLRRAASENGSGMAVTTVDRSVTYAELLDLAQTAAANLGALGVGRLGVVEPDPISAIAVVSGCAAAGVEACFYPLAANAELIAENRDAFDHATLVTSRPEIAGPGVIRTETLLAGSGAPEPEPTASAPLLVLTSGTTTGRPRAARHDWHALTRAATKLRATPDQKWMLSYGLNQFGGLQVLFHVFGARASLFVPDSFQPRAAAGAMARWSITHASGTPTFWRFLLLELARGDQPLPPLSQITLSGEPVPADVLEQVRATFPAAHVSQVYAATEFGGAITVSDGLAGIPLADLAGTGIEFDVRDDELWVRSAAATTGYYGQERQEPGEWRPTGDLVEVVDERVQFRGRASEVINVGGVKVHPVPIEDKVRDVAGVLLARAYGRPNALVGAIVAVDVVVDDGVDADGITRDIRAACADLPPAWRPRSVNVVDALPINGNKISRGATSP